MACSFAHEIDTRSFQYDRLQRKKQASRKGKKAGGTTEAEGEAQAEADRPGTAAAAASVDGGVQAGQGDNDEGATTEGDVDMLL